MANNKLQALEGPWTERCLSVVFVGWRRRGCRAGAGGSRLKKNTFFLDDVLAPQMAQGSLTQGSRTQVTDWGASYVAGLGFGWFIHLAARVPCAVLCQFNCPQVEKAEKLLKAGSELCSPPREIFNGCDLS